MNHSSKVISDDTKGTRFTNVPSALVIIWGTWAVLVLTLSIAKPQTESSALPIEYVVVALHLLVATVSLLASLPRLVGGLLASGLVVRTFVVFWDLNFRDVFQLVHSGADSEGFFRTALQVANDHSLLGENIYGGMYSKLSGILFYLIGPLRGFAQYTNALLFVTAIFLVYKILDDVGKVPQEVVSRVVAVGVFFPNAIIISSIFLRESLIVFSVAASAYWFHRWLRHGSLFRVLVAFSFVLFASTFHSGVVVVIAVYALAFAFYDRNLGNVKFGAKSIVRFIAMTPVLAYVVFQNSDLFLERLKGYESSEELYEQVSSSSGGSAYLQGLSIDNAGELLLFGPVKAFYFLAAPLPWDFRGVPDLITFVVDSVFYVTVLFLAFRYYRKIDGNITLFLVALTSVVLVSVIFGAGVSNAGTALRHRLKIFPFFLILYGLIGARRRTVNRKSLETERQFDNS